MEVDTGNTNVSKDNLPFFDDISPEKDGKVLKTITKPGDADSGEKPFSGCKVYVHYVGRLENGEKFDSSRDRGEPFAFELGKGSVIKGWDVGVATMYRNEICELKISSEFGYGEKGFPPKIPENATLIFEVELLSWDDEEITEDKGVMKRVLSEGISLNKPNQDGTVKVHLRGSYGGQLFDERDVRFVIGEGYKHDIIDGVELAICKMKKHEKARVFINSKYAFKEEGSEKFYVPPDTNVVYEICLFDFEKAKEIYEMNYDEKIEKAKVLKEQGLACIQAQQYEKALGYYDRVVTFLRINKEDSDYIRGLTLKIAALSNAALCSLKLRNFAEAQKRCEKVLKLDENHVKCHFRLGEAYLGLKEYELASKSFEHVLKLEPNNTAAKRQSEHSKALLKNQIEKEKKLYGHMFAKLSS